MPPETDKSFDCVAFKRQAQSRIYERTRHMTAEQEIAYHRQSVRRGPFADWVQRIVGEQSPQRPAGPAEPQDH